MWEMRLAIPKGNADIVTMWEVLVLLIFEKRLLRQSLVNFAINSVGEMVALL